MKKRKKENLVLKIIITIVAIVILFYAYLAFTR